MEAGHGEELSEWGAGETECVQKPPKWEGAKGWNRRSGGLNPHEHGRKWGKRGWRERQTPKHGVLNTRSQQDITHWQNLAHSLCWSGPPAKNVFIILNA